MEHVQAEASLGNLEASLDSKSQTFGVRLLSYLKRPSIVQGRHFPFPPLPFSPPLPDHCPNDSSSVIFCSVFSNLREILG